MDTKTFRCIYGVATDGRIYYYCQNSWNELVEDGGDADLRFKRISSSLNSLWAVGGNHQVFVRLLQSDVPIRIKEEVFILIYSNFTAEGCFHYFNFFLQTYENQRWNPIDGFCNKLLPTDRPPYSSVDGLERRNFSDFVLPSQSWSWDEDWHLDLVNEGQQLEPEVT